MTRLVIAIVGLAVGCALSESIGGERVVVFTGLVWAVVAAAYPRALQ